MVISWWICRQEQTMGYVLVQTLNPFPRNFISLNDWTFKVFGKCTERLSTIRGSQFLYRTCKTFFHQSCPNMIDRFLFKTIVNLLKRKLQSIRRHHATSSWDKIWWLFLRKSTWKQKRDFLPSDRRLRLIKAITPTVVSPLVLLWCSLLSFLLLCTTKIWIPIQL